MQFFFYALNMRGDDNFQLLYSMFNLRDKIFKPSIGRYFMRRKILLEFPKNVDGRMGVSLHN